MKHAVTGVASGGQISPALARQCDAEPWAAMRVLRLGSIAPCSTCCGACSGAVSASLVTAALASTPASLGAPGHEGNQKPSAHTGTPGYHLDKTCLSRPRARTGWRARTRRSPSCNRRGEVRLPMPHARHRWLTGRVRCRAAWIACAACVACVPAAVERRKINGAGDGRGSVGVGARVSRPTRSAAMEVPDCPPLPRARRGPKQAAGDHR